MIKEQEAFGER